MSRYENADLFHEIVKKEKKIKALEARIQIDDYLIEAKETKLRELKSHRRLQERNLLSIQQLQEDISRIRVRKQSLLQRLEQIRNIKHGHSTSLSPCI